MSNAAPEAEAESPADLRTKFEASQFTLQTELALTRAGYDTTSKVGQAFLADVAAAAAGKKEALTGDLFEKAAKDWGLAPTPAAAPAAQEPATPAAPATQQQQEGATPAPATQTGTGTQEADAHRVADELGNTGEVPDPDASTAHPADVGLGKFQGRLQEGATPDEAAAEYFDRMVDAGGKGDARVLDTTVPNIQPAHCP
jgi:hypothetical protein